MLEQAGDTVVTAGTAGRGDLDQAEVDVGVVIDDGH
jgi:hypothetical protein